MQLATRNLLPNALSKRERARARTRPVWLVNKHLGANPWQKQKDILNALRDHEFVAVRSCNSSGKTFTAALATIWWLMAHERATVITTAPSDRQVKEFLWREIRSIYDRNRRLIGGKITATSLELSNKRFAYGFSTNTAERFQGFHNENVLIIVDEASGVREFIFDAILGALTSDNSKMLMIGNPTSLAGNFYDAFHKNRQYWKTIHISAFDTLAFQSGSTRPLSPPHARRDLCKTIGFPPFTGEMSGGQRGPLQDDQANIAADKSFAKVSARQGETLAPKCRVTTATTFRVARKRGSHQPNPNRQFKQPTPQITAHHPNHKSSSRTPIRDHSSAPQHP